MGPGQIDIQGAAAESAFVVGPSYPGSSTLGNTMSEELQVPGNKLQEGEITQWPSHLLGLGSGVEGNREKGFREPTKTIAVMWFIRGRNIARIAGSV